MTSFLIQTTLSAVFAFATGCSRDAHVDLGLRRRDTSSRV